METRAPESEQWRLISLPMSHYCEKARWALDLSGISYTEDPHLLPFHRSITRSFGGSTVPVLLTPEQAVTDSSDILRFLDQQTSVQLYPDREDDGSTQLEQMLNQQLGPAVRRWFYFHVLGQEELLRYFWCHGTPSREQATYWRILPRIKRMAVDSFDISAKSTQLAIETIYQIFEQVEILLADGRPYLLGQTLSALDITLAALAAPILLPPEHPMALPHSFAPLLPRAMQQEIIACRTTLTGEFVLRLYQQRRGLPPKKGSLAL